MVDVGSGAKPTDDGGVPPEYERARICHCNTARWIIVLGPFRQSLACQTRRRGSTCEIIMAGARVAGFMHAIVHRWRHRKLTSLAPRVFAG